MILHLSKGTFQLVSCAVLGKVVPTKALRQTAQRTVLSVTIVHVEPVTTKSSLVPRVRFSPLWSYITKNWDLVIRVWMKGFCSLGLWCDDLPVWGLWRKYSLDFQPNVYVYVVVDLLKLVLHRDVRKLGQFTIRQGVFWMFGREILWWPGRDRARVPGRTLLSSRTYFFQYSVSLSCGNV